jgi:hypothetical protein
MQIVVTTFNVPSAEEQYTFLLSLLVFQKADAAVSLMQFVNVPWNLTGPQALLPNIFFEKAVRHK